MRFLKFFALLLTTLLLAILVERQIPVGSSQIPPLARFLSPFEGYLQSNKLASIKSEVIDLDALSAPVKVVYDDRHVPHIFADNAPDAFMAQGYVVARDRLWQMDFISRSVSGRLSEVLGALTVDYDKQVLRQGLLYGAENSLESWKQHPESFGYVEAYAAGVNAAMAECSERVVPIEFKLLNYQPEAWTTLKTAMVLMAMSRDLNYAHADLGNTRAITLLGEDLFATLFRNRVYGDRPIIPKGTIWDFDSVIQVADTLPLEVIANGGGLSDEPDFEDDGIGSNNWAITGKKSASGHPILCSDPHLGLNLPSLWYEVHLHTPEMNVRGVSLPGIPGIIIGFNDHIAWGLTNGGHDVLDWYKINWIDRDKGLYFWGAQTRKADKRVAEIKVRGEASVYDTILYTHHGPITYSDKAHPLYDCSMKWIAHHGWGKSNIRTIAEINRAENYNAFARAIEYYPGPVQNFVYADKQGNIGLRVGGLLPVRKVNQGRFIQNGSNPGSGWQGMIPADHMPQIQNPERGYVASANQWATDSNYPYYLFGRYEDFRNRYLNAVLDTMNSATLRDMQVLQNDNFSLRGTETVEAIVGKVKRDSLSTRQLGLLSDFSNWDGTFEAHARMPVFHEILSDALYRNTFDELRAVDSNYIRYPDFWILLDMIKNDPEHEIFNVLKTDSAESAGDIVTIAFRKAADDYFELLEEDNKMQWSTYRNTYIMHVARIPAFSTERISSGGYYDALNAISATSGPSWRMIVELGDRPYGLGVYPGGQSGHPGSPYYDNFVHTWETGQYYELDLPTDAKSISEPLFTIDLTSK